MMPLSKKQLSTTEKITTSEEVNNGTRNLDDTKEEVVTTQLLQKKILTNEGVPKREEDGRCTKYLHDMKEAVVTTHGNYLYNFEGRSKVSTGWFNLDHDFFKERVFYN